MDNSAKSELLVPGFDTIQINYELPSAERFAQYAEWRQMPAITARELPMMRLMKTITDKSKRHVDFFDLRRVADWQEEALHLSLINESAFAWCISELRDKAADFGEKGHVRVLDTDYGMSADFADYEIEDYYAQALPLLSATRIRAAVLN